jgi:hypothetical protein
MYDEAMDGIKKHLVGRTKKSNLMFTQELHPAKHPETGEQYVQVVSSETHETDKQDMEGSPQARPLGLFPRRIIPPRRH